MVSPWTRWVTQGKARSGWVVSGWSWARTLFSTSSSTVSIIFPSSHFFGLPAMPLCFIGYPPDVILWLHSLKFHKIPTFKSYTVDIISSCKLRQWSICRFGSHGQPACTLSHDVVGSIWQPWGATVLQRQARFLWWGLVMITAMVMGTFETLMFKESQSQWTPPIFIDPNLDNTYSRTYSRFWGVLLFLLGCTLAICGLY